MMLNVPSKNMYTGTLLSLPTIEVKRLSPISLPEKDITETIIFWQNKYWEEMR